MRVTADWLKAKRACPKQVAVFEAEWPDGLDLTLEVIERALVLDLDLGWFATRALQGRQWDKFQAAWNDAEYVWTMKAPRDGIRGSWPRQKRQTKACRTYKRAVADALIAAVEIGRRLCTVEMQTALAKLKQAKGE